MLARRTTAVVFRATRRPTSSAACATKAPPRAEDTNAAVVTQPRFDGRKLARVGEIGLQNVDSNTRLVAKRRSKSLHSLLVAGHQREIMSAAGGTVRLSRSDARGSSGDKDGGNFSHDLILSQGTLLTGIVMFDEPRWILVCYRDDDFALCAPSLDIGERIASFFERENPIQDRTDYAGFDQGRDFAQLLSLCSHKQE